MAVLWIISMWWCHKCHLPLTVSLSLFCVLSSFSLPLTSDSSDLSLLFFFFFSSLSLTLSTLIPSWLTVKPLSSQDRLWVGGLQIGVGGLQIGVGGSRSEWVASDWRGWLQTRMGSWVIVGAWVAVGSWMAMDGHGFCC